METVKVSTNVAEDRIISLADVIKHFERAIGKLDRCLDKINSTTKTIENQNDKKENK